MGSVVPGEVVHELQEHGGGGGQGGVGEIEVVVVERGVFGSSLRADADHEECAGDLAEVVGEVFAAHDGDGGGVKAVAERFGGEFDAFEPSGVVPRDGVARLVLDLGGASVGDGDAVAAAEEGLAGGFAGGVGEGADGGFDAGGVGDDVGGGACVELADGDDDGVGGVGGAADLGLEVEDEFGGGDDGVDAEVGCGPVAAAAAECDSEGVGGGEEGTGAAGEAADGEGGPAVEAVDGVDLGADAAVENAGLDHAFGPPAAFFGGLEQQFDANVEGVDGSLEDGGGEEEVGGVSVVSAGVHSPGAGGGVGEAGGFGDGEGVDVGAEGDAGFGAVAEDGHGRGGSAVDAGGEGDAEACELATDRFGGVELFVGGLRDAVERVTQFDRVAQFRFGRMGRRGHRGCHVQSLVGGVGEDNRPRGAAGLEQAGEAGDGPGLLDVEREAGAEHVDGGELSGVAEVVQHLDAEQLAVEVAVEADEVDFDLATGVAEGGEGADVDGGGVGGVGEAYAPCVDAVGGDDVAGAVEVGGGEAERATASEALHDAAHEVQRPAEADAGIPHAAQPGEGADQ